MPETAVAELGPQYRTVFRLRDIEGFSTEENSTDSEHFGPGGKTRLPRARLHLHDIWPLATAGAVILLPLRCWHKGNLSRRSLSQSVTTV